MATITRSGQKKSAKPRPLLGRKGKGSSGLSGSVGKRGTPPRGGSRDRKKRKPSIGPEELKKMKADWAAFEEKKTAFEKRVAEYEGYKKENEVLKNEVDQLSANLEAATVMSNLSDEGQDGLYKKLKLENFELTRTVEKQKKDLGQEVAMVADLEEQLAAAQKEGDIRDAALVKLKTEIGTTRKERDEAVAALAMEKEEHEGDTVMIQALQEELSQAIMAAEDVSKAPQVTAEIRSLKEELAATRRMKDEATAALMELKEQCAMIEIQAASRSIQTTRQSIAHVSPSSVAQASQRNLSYAGTLNAMQQQPSEHASSSSSAAGGGGGTSSEAFPSVRDAGGGGGVGVVGDGNGGARADRIEDMRQQVRELTAAAQAAEDKAEEAEEERRKASNDVDALKQQLVSERETLAARERAAEAENAQARHDAEELARTKERMHLLVGQVEDKNAAIRELQERALKAQSDAEELRRKYNPTIEELEQDRGEEANSAFLLESGGTFRALRKAFRSKEGDAENLMHLITKAMSDRKHRIRLAEDANKARAMRIKHLAELEGKDKKEWEQESMAMVKYQQLCEHVRTGMVELGKVVRPEVLIRLAPDPSTTMNRTGGGGFKKDDGVQSEAHLAVQSYKKIQDTIAEMQRMLRRHAAHLERQQSASADSVEAMTEMYDELRGAGVDAVASRQAAQSFEDGLTQTTNTTIARSTMQSASLESIIDALELEFERYKAQGPAAERVLRKKLDQREKQTHDLLLAASDARKREKASAAEFEQERRSFAKRIKSLESRLHSTQSRATGRQQLQRGLEEKVRLLEHKLDRVEDSKGRLYDGLQQAHMAKIVMKQKSKSLRSDMDEKAATVERLQARLLAANKERRGERKAMQELKDSIPDRIKRATTKIRKEREEAEGQLRVMRMMLKAAQKQGKAAKRKPKRSGRRRGGGGGGRMSDADMLSTDDFAATMKRVKGYTSSPTARAGLGAGLDELTGPATSSAGRMAAEDMGSSRASAFMMMTI